MEWTRPSLDAHTRKTSPVPFSSFQSPLLDSSSSSLMDAVGFDLFDSTGRLLEKGRGQSLAFYSQAKQWLRTIKNDHGAMTLHSEKAGRTMLVEASCACSLALRPSFLHKEGVTSSLKQRQSSTMYLHGVRGIACYIVYTYHVHWGLSFRDIVPGYAPDRFPILGSLFQGTSQVAVFFIVSGFSIAYKAVSQVQSGEMASASDTLGSSIFRRWPRLYLPVIALTLVEGLIAYAGLVGHTMGSFTALPRFPSLTAQLRHVFDDLVFFTNPLRSALNHDMWDRPHTDYDSNTWTLPFEFIGSMAVFLTISAGARVKFRVRIVGIVLLAVTAWYMMLWEIYLFLAGLLLAEIHCSRFQETSTAKRKPRRLGQVIQTICWRAYCIGQFVIALYLLSVPGDIGSSETAPQYFATAWTIVPQSWLAAHLGERFWTSIAATYLMVVLETAPFLQILFTNRVAQYLGRISYSLYLVHSTTYRIFGWWIHDALSSTNIVFRAFFSYFLLTLVTIWVADLTTRAIDERVVKFNRWMYNKLCQSSQDQRKGS